jgi:hypothetical protein
MSPGRSPHAQAAELKISTPTILKGNAAATPRMTLSQPLKPHKREPWRAQPIAAIRERSFLVENRRD